MKNLLVSLSILLGSAAFGLCPEPAPYVYDPTSMHEVNSPPTFYPGNLICKVRFQSYERRKKVYFSHNELGSNQNRKCTNRENILLTRKNIDTGEKLEKYTLRVKDLSVQSIYWRATLDGKGWHWKASQQPYLAITGGSKSLQFPLKTSFMGIKVAYSHRKILANFLAEHSKTELYSYSDRFEKDMPVVDMNVVCGFEKRAPTKKF